ncbi:hypothetical protein FGIG_11195 [Fasciola gigantica]|uniref:RING-type domain-containing protein n=1 Tax=Fasciola gigantica TaxID=46835 RepID=A0A504YHX1_FASGI|nr:hypothetical protein FGIG_11195 [Fasciola gigantica]
MTPDCFERLFNAISFNGCSLILSDLATKSNASQPDLHLCCSKCNIQPARTPLISTCQHIACFSCWREVIEEGNRRCPSCQTLLRRRNLTRLIIPDDAVR